MSAELGALVTDPAVKDLLAVNYMRWEQREEHRHDIEEVETVLNDPARRKDIQQPGKLRQQTDLRKRNLAAQTPPLLTPAQRDKIARIERVARETFTEAMPTQEQMRHAPPGALDHHQAWEAQHKRAILLWKRCQMLLHPTSQARDLANIERFRPSQATRSLMTDALINRPFALSPEAKAHYDEINWDDPGVKAQLEQAVRAGKVKINLKARRGALRPQNDKGKVYTCPADACGGRIFSGGFAKRNYDRHQESHRVVGQGAPVGHGVSA